MLVNATDEARAATEDEAGETPTAVQDFLAGLPRQRPAPMPPRQRPYSPSMPAPHGSAQGPFEKAALKRGWGMCNGLSSQRLVGIPRGSWPRPSGPLPKGWGRVSAHRWGPYSHTYGRRGARRGLEASSRRKGKGALGVASPESTHSQWCWPTSIWAWEFPAQGWSQAQTLDPDQGHSGKCSPLGVGRAV